MGKRSALALLSTLVVAGFVLIGAGAAAAATGPEVGYDISYPQCNGSFPGSGTLRIVGVNGGRAYSPNPCLGTGDGPSELSWAGTNAILYVNTGDPGPALSTHWPNGQTSPQQCNTSTNPGSDTPACHYDYGWNAAADSYRDAVNAYVSLGLAPAGATSTPVANQWWLDVETANSWTSSTSLNVQALQGEAEYLASAGAAGVGFYAGSSSWQTITGNTAAFASYPSWVPGAGTLTNAQSKCGGVGPSMGPVALAQYASGGFDGDVRCTTQPGLSFGTAPQTIAAGAQSAPMFVQVAQASTSPITVTVTSSSTTGMFSSPDSGSWTSSFSTTVPAGGTSTPTFLYQDVTAGTPTLTASASGYASGTQSETVVAGPVATVLVTPQNATVSFGGGQLFSATASDADGNAISTSGASWSTTAPGTVSPANGAQTTFTAGSTVGSGSVSATVQGVTGSASVSVVASRNMNVVVTKGTVSRSGRRFVVPLTTAASDASSGAAIAGGSVTVRVASGTCSGPVVATTSGSTSSNGTFAWSFRTKTRGTYCALATVTANGFTQGSGSLAFVV